MMQHRDRDRLKYVMGALLLEAFEESTKPSHERVFDIVEYISYHGDNEEVRYE